MEWEATWRVLRKIVVAFLLFVMMLGASWIAWQLVTVASETVSTPGSILVRIDGPEHLKQAHIDIEIIHDPTEDLWRVRLVAATYQIAPEIDDVEFDVYASSMEMEFRCPSNFKGSCRVSESTTYSISLDPVWQEMGNTQLIAVGYFEISSEEDVFVSCGMFRCVMAIPSIDWLEGSRSIERSDVTSSLRIEHSGIANKYWSSQPLLTGSSMYRYDTIRRSRTTTSAVGARFLDEGFTLGYDSGRDQLLFIAGALAGVAGGVFVALIERVLRD